MMPVKLLLVLTVLTVVLSGCATNKVVIHPIEKSDITRMTKGVCYPPEKDGYFLSDLYVSQVMQAKVDNANTK
jgi:hypothetical protein